MATIDTIKFTDVALQIGNGATPEVFTTLCGVTSVTKSYSVNTNNEDLPDCSAPDAVGFEGGTVISVGVQYAAQGFVDVTASEALVRLAFAGDPISARFVYNKGAKVGYEAFTAIMTAGEEAYERRTSGKLSFTLKAVTKPVFVPG